MEALSLSAPLYPIANATPFFSSIVAGKHSFATPSAASGGGFSFSLSLKAPPESGNSTNSPALSGNLRRPNQSLKTSIPSSQPPPTAKVPANPLKNPLSSAHPPPSDVSHSLANKLWLSSKLSAPPPLHSPPPPPTGTEIGNGENDEIGSSEKSSTDNPPAVEFRREGKIFVGNLPNWIKKIEVAEFFRQFGPIKNVILIKSHHETGRNAGFGFVIYGGPTAAKAAIKAEEFDGVEFHGRVLTVKLDDGRRLKEKMAERARWVDGEDEVDYRSKWHEERDISVKEFKKVLETEPENWQAVVRSFERIKKVELLSTLNLCAFLFNYSVKVLVMC